MSIYFAGTFTRSSGLMSAVGKQIKLLNFKAVSRVTIKFDPFDEKANTLRDYLSYISSPKLSTNFPNLQVKTDIVCNRETPTVTYQFIPAIQEKEQVKTVKINAENLTILDLLTVTNQQVSSRAPKEEPVSTLKTKSEKKGAVKRK